MLTEFGLQIHPVCPGTSCRSPQSLLLDQKLCENPHYAYCRSLGQLLKPRLFIVSGVGFDAYSREMMRRGMRLGDIKPIALSPDDGWSHRFEGSYLIDEAAFEHR